MNGRQNANSDPARFLDIDIPIDQALQFIVSCGVVVPPQQLQTALEQRDAHVGDATQSPAAMPSSADEDAAKLDSTLPTSGS